MSKDDYARIHSSMEKLLEKNIFGSGSFGTRSESYGSRIPGGARASLQYLRPWTLSPRRAGR